MKKDKKPTIDIVIFFVSLLVTLLWILTSNINVYENKLIGIIAEILWLPLILLIFVLPITTFVLIFSRKLEKSKNLFLALAIQITILIIQIAK